MPKEKKVKKSKVVRYGLVALLVVGLVAVVVATNNGGVLKGALTRRGAITELGAPQVNMANGTARYMFQGTGFDQSAKGSIGVSCDACTARIIWYDANTLYYPLSGVTNIEFSGLKPGTTYHASILVIDDNANAYTLHPTIVVPVVNALTAGSPASVNAYAGTATYSFTSNFTGTFDVNCPGCSWSNVGMVANQLTDPKKVAIGTNSLQFSGLKPGVTYAPVITAFDAQGKYYTLSVPSFSFSAPATYGVPVMRSVPRF